MIALKKESKPASGSVRKVPSDPLIPTSIIDTALQKAYLAGLFLLIQAWKIQQCIILKTSSSSGDYDRFLFVLRFFILDLLYLWLLPVFRVPMLSFNPFVTFLQLILVTSFTLFLACDMSFLFASVAPLSALIPTSKSTSTPSSYVPHHRSIPVDSEIETIGSESRSPHLKGAKTIQILPKLALIFNPENIFYCIENAAITVPVALNASSELASLELTYTDFANHSKVTEIKGKRLSKLRNGDKLSLPAEKPGFYEVTNAVDSRGLAVKVYNPLVLIASCPKAKITHNNQRDVLCLGDHNNVAISVTGVPPLNVKYRELVNEKVNTVEKSLRDNEGVTPFLGLFSAFHKSGVSQSYENMPHLNELVNAQDYPLFDSKEAAINVDSVITLPGDYTYELVEVIDGLGNTVNIESQSVSTVAYGSPTLFLLDTRPGKPMKEGEKRGLRLVIDEHQRDSYKNLAALKKLGSIPATIKYTAEHSPNTHKNISFVFNQENDYTFEATTSGNFALSEVHLDICPGKVTSDSVDVFFAAKPDLTVLLNTSIEDVCLGPIGLQFDLLLAGTPPFEVKVSQYLLKGRSRHLLGTKKIRVPQLNRVQYKYEPPKEGEYEVEFSALRDGIYSDFLNLGDKYTFRTSMRAKPGAEIDASIGRKTELCPGVKPKVLPVKLAGEAPFEVTYDIVEKASSKRKTYTAKNIQNNVYDLQLPVFSHGGDYSILLTLVKDRSGCMVLVSGQETVIHVAKELPFATFEGSQKIQRAQLKEGGVVGLPIRAGGSDRISVEYTHITESGETEELNSILLNKHKKPSVYDEIKVRSPGVYKLRSVEDSLCSGKVNSESIFNVLYIPTPEMRVSESRALKVKQIGSDTFSKESVCVEARRNAVDLVLSGSAPFEVEYTIETPKSGTKRKTVRLSLNTLLINVLDELRAEEGVPGAYKYTFKSISDSVYSMADMARLGKQKPQVVYQTVVEPPNARFGGARRLQTCLNNLAHRDEIGAFLDPVILDLSGMSPFEIHLEILNENFGKYSSIVLQNVTSKRVHLNKEIVKYLSLGRHMVSIKKIVDGRGCVKDDFSPVLKDFLANLKDHQLVILITDAPKITKVTLHLDICVGDDVEYKLYGSGPFEVSYVFNDRELSAKVDSSFRRRIVEPGHLYITKITDTFGCQLRLDGGQRPLSVDVHGQPSVEILNPGYEKIQEGDEVVILFKFLGEGPFDMIYQREHEGRVEVHSVEGIEGDEYRVRTSLGGKYAAVEVRDRWCEVTK